MTGKARSTIQRHAGKGKLTVEKDGKGNPVIDLSELERVYGEVLQPDMEQPVAMRQSAPPNDTGGVGNVQAEIKRLREERERERRQLEEVISDLRQDRNHWRQQATALLTDQRKKPDGGLTFWRWLGIAKK